MQEFSLAQSLSCVQLFVTPWTAACQASLSITNSQNLPKLMSIELGILSNHLILCHPLLLLPSIFPGIRIFSNESVLHIRWPEYWSFSFSIRPSNEYSGLISFRIDWFDLLAVQGILKSVLQHHISKASIFCHSAFFMVQPSHPYILVCILFEKENDRITRLFCVLCVNSSFLKNIGINLIYSVVSVSCVQQSESVIHIHVSSF